MMQSSFHSPRLFLLDVVFSPDEQTQELSAIALKLVLVKKMQFHNLVQRKKKPLTEGEKNMFARLRLRLR